MKQETIAPSIRLDDGRTVVPEGWMWVLGFALAGVPWAIEEVESPAFKARLRKHYEDKHKAEVEQEIADLEKRLAILKAQR